MPGSYLLFGLFQRNAVTLLNLAEQLVTLAGNHIEIVIGQLAPLLLDLALEFKPVTFYAILVHGFLLRILMICLGSVAAFTTVKSLLQMDKS